MFLYMYLKPFFMTDLFFVVVHIFQDILYIEFLCIYIYFILNLYSITFLNIQRVSAKKTSDDQSPIPNPLLVTVQTLASIVSSGR